MIKPDQPQCRDCLGAEGATAGRVLADMATQMAFAKGELKLANALRDAAYVERNRVVAGFCALALRLGYAVGRTVTEIEGWEPEWRCCVYVDLPEGQVSWHYHVDDGALFDWLPEYGGAWDGHDTAEKYRRVAALR